MNKLTLKIIKQTNSLVNQKKLKEKLDRNLSFRFKIHILKGGSDATGSDSQWRVIRFHMENEYIRAQTRLAQGQIAHKTAADFWLSQSMVLKVLAGCFIGSQAVEGAILGSFGMLFVAACLPYELTVGFVKLDWHLLDIEDLRTFLQDYLNKHPTKIPKYFHYFIRTGKVPNPPDAEQREGVQQFLSNS